MTPDTPLEWDRRLITPGRALELGGGRPLFVRAMEDTPPGFYCGSCRRLVATLGWRFSVAELLAAVLRHEVIHHELSLAKPSEGDPDERGARRPEGPGDLGGRPPGAEPDPDPGGRLAEAPAGRRASGRP